MISLQTSVSKRTFLHIMQEMLQSLQDNNSNQTITSLMINANITNSYLSFKNKFFDSKRTGAITFKK